MNPEMLAGDDIASIKMYLSNKGNGKKKFKKKEPIQFKLFQRKFYFNQVLEKKTDQMHN